MTTFDIEVRVCVTVEASSQEEAEAIAGDCCGVAVGAPDSIQFISAEIL